MRLQDKFSEKNSDQINQFPEKKETGVFINNLIQRSKRGIRNKILTTAALAGLVSIAANSKSVNLFVQETGDALEKAATLSEKTSTVLNHNRWERLETNIKNEATLPLLIEYGFWVTKNHKPGQKLYLHFPMTFPADGKYTFKIPHLDKLNDFTIGGKSAREGITDPVTGEQTKFSYANYAKTYNNTLGITLASKNSHPAMNAAGTPTDLVGESTNVTLVFDLDEH